MKKFFILISFLLLTFSQVGAVAVHCGSPLIVNNSPTGNYIFSNTDNNTVRVSIDNKFSIISVIPNNTFILAPHESKIIGFRAYHDMYSKLFVTYTDITNGFSASLECPFFASTADTNIPNITTTTSTSTTIPTTTTIPLVCSSLDFWLCSMQSHCRWTGDFRFGRCTSLSTTTTIPSTSTSTTIPPTTTTQQTTTTIQSNCYGKNFYTCSSTPGCQWYGNLVIGYCRSTQSTTTTVPTTTTTQQTTTTIPTTTTICPSTCIRWLRPFICLEWRNICIA